MPDCKSFVALGLDQGNTQSLIKIEELSIPSGPNSHLPWRAQGPKCVWLVQASSQCVAHMHFQRTKPLSNRQTTVCFQTHHQGTSLWPETSPGS